MILRTLKRSALAQSIARRPPGLYHFYRDFLDRYMELDRSERRALDDRRLSRLLGAARRTEAFAGVNEWRDVPLLSKAEVRAAPHRWQRRGLLPASSERTSGTSGASLEVVRSFRNVAFEQATIDWVVARAGLEFRRQRVLVLRGNQIKDPADTSPPFWKMADGGRSMVLSANHLNPMNYPVILSAVRAFRPDILYAYPSAAENLANLAEQAGGQLRFGLVLTSSEMAPAPLRRKLGRVFGAPTLDYYGQAERVAFAWSSEPDSYRFLGAYGKVELLPDGAVAEIVGTGYANDAQPLLRYRTGDEIAGSELADPEAVALGLTPFSGISGRASDVIHGPNGETFIALNHIPRGFDEIDRLQLIQTDPDRVEILVQSIEQSDALRAAILLAARAKIGPVIRLDLFFVQEPRRTAGGKAPLVIHDWKPG